MSEKELAALSADELVEQFAAFSIEQDEALLSEDGPEVKRLFWRLAGIEDELKNRNGDQRKVLDRLFQHQSAHVRLCAAKASLAVNPAESRRVLQDIQERDNGFQKLDAGMTLWSLDQGIFKPT